MSNFISTVAVNALTWTALSAAETLVQVTNTAGQPIALAVADASANILGSVVIPNGNDYTFSAVPVGAHVFAKIATSTKTTVKGATGKDPHTNTQKAYSGNVTVYKT